MAAAGQDGAAGKGQGAPGVQVAGQHLHQAGGGPDVPAHADGVALVGQVAGEGGGPFGGAGIEGDGVPLFDHGVKVLQQAAQLPVPAGGDVGLGVDEVLELELVHPPQEVLAQEGGVLLRGCGQAGHGLVEHVQAGAEQPFFQQAGQLLAAAVLGGLLGVPDAAHLIQDEQGRVQVVQQGGRLGVADAVVFVHGLGHLAGVQLGQLGGHGLLEGGAVLAAGLFDGGPQGPGRLLAAAEQDLAGRGEVDLLQRGVPPLAHQVEGGDGVDLLVPEFQPGRGGHVGGVNVHDVAPDAELAGPLHLAAADIPRREQLPDQRVPGKLHPRFEGQGVGHELGPGDGVLQQGFHRDADGFQPAARQRAQHRQAAVFVFAAGAFHRAEHEVPRGKDVGRHPQRFEVVGKVGGLGLAGGHDAEGAAQVAGQQGIDQGPPGGGQAEQRSRARRGQAGGDLLVFGGLFEQGLIHGAFTSQSMGPDVTGCICFALRTACRP